MVVNADTKATVTSTNASVANRKIDLIKKPDDKLHKQLYKIICSRFFAADQKRAAHIFSSLQPRILGQSQKIQCGDSRPRLSVERSSTFACSAQQSDDYQKGHPATISRNLILIATFCFLRCAMTHSLEYHLSVQRWIPASVAVFGVLAFAALITPNTHAQVNGTPASVTSHGAPASVTSPGFGGHVINGVSPSVTSVGPRGFAPTPSTGRSFGTTVPRGGEHHDHGANHEHHRSRETPIYGGVYAVPVPYAVPYDDSDTQSPDDEDQYQGGPTVFDRRGAGAESYVPPVTDMSPAHPARFNGAESATNDPEPLIPQEPTLLVFRDGHKIEIANYAIVGQTLFDLTSGHPRKIALAELDLNETQKQNDDRGVSFQLPPGIQTN
jgi:hypothetical protein